MIREYLVGLHLCTYSVHVNICMYRNHNNITVEYSWFMNVLVAPTHYSILFLATHVMIVGVELDYVMWLPAGYLFFFCLKER